MGFPTDVRSKNSSGFYGIDGIWNEIGNEITDNAPHDIRSATNKAGRLNGVYVMSKNPDLEIHILLDGVDIMGGYKERLSWVMARHGSCGEFGFVVLDRYDTTNDKYVLLVEGPLEYGASLQVYVRNPLGPPIPTVRCCGVVDWVENQ